MLIIKYTLDGVEQLDPSFYSAAHRDDAEARAREIGGWVEESDLTPTELMERAGWPRCAPALEQRTRLKP